MHTDRFRPHDLPARSVEARDRVGKDKYRATGCLCERAGGSRGAAVGGSEDFPPVSIRQFAASGGEFLQGVYQFAACLFVNAFVGRDESRADVARQARLTVEVEHGEGGFHDERAVVRDSGECADGPGRSAAVAGADADLDAVGELPGQPGAGLINRNHGLIGRGSNTRQHYQKLEPHVKSPLPSVCFYNYTRLPV